MDVLEERQLDEPLPMEPTINTDNLIERDKILPDSSENLIERDKVRHIVRVVAVKGMNRESTSYSPQVSEN